MGTLLTTAANNDAFFSFVCMRLSGTHRPVESVHGLLECGQGPGRDLERGRGLVEVTGPGLVSLRGRDGVELRGHPRQRDQHLARARAGTARDLEF